MIYLHNETECSRLVHFTTVFERYVEVVVQTARQTLASILRKYIKNNNNNSN